MIWDEDQRGVICEAEVVNNIKFQREENDHILS